MLTTRRGLIGILAGAIAAPLVVKATSIMPVKAMPSNDILALLEKRMMDARRVLADSLSQNLFEDSGFHSEFPLLRVVDTDLAHLDRVWKYKQISQSVIIRSIT